MSHVLKRVLVAATLMLSPLSGALAEGLMLPAGYLSTHGNQIIDDAGNPVRIAAVGWNGADGGAYAPQGLDRINYRTTMRQMVAAGFNTVRIAFCDQMLTARPQRNAIDYRRNPELMDLSALQVLDKIIDYAGQIGLKVILDHHNNEGGGGPYRLGGQQPNGLWFDLGPGSTNEDNGDGTGNPGTVSAATFRANWVMLARRYAGNATVIGFDLHNEPSQGPKGNGINWGDGGPTDLHAMCTTVGAATQAVNPGPLVICEGLQDYGSGAPDGDLRGTVEKPLVLPVAHKVVYSVHEFPREIANAIPDSGPGAIERMNRAWGHLVINNVAPVFVGEMGSSMLTKESRAWGETLISYMNGSAPGGPRFGDGEQPVSGCWWAWGDLAGQVPRGVLQHGWNPATNGYHAEQRAIWSKLLFTSR
jgi:aryl-phospho-beta-D-glucosidase BglC (GH1 family)